MLYIINPAGNGGAGIHAWDDFKSCWPDSIDPIHVHFTERPGHARKIAAAGQTYDILAAVGGDGTVGEIISGMMDMPGIKPRLAVIPCGTGNDVAQNAGIFSIDDAATALRNGYSRAFDLIRVDKEDECRHAFLFGNAGFSSAPKMRPWMKRLLGARGAYFLATFLQIIVYRAPHMTVRIDGHEHSGKIYLVITGNAEWAGGGCMRVCPGARTDDGLLNVAVIASASVCRVITKVFTCITSGAHIDLPEVAYRTGRKIEVHSEPPAALDLDGELFGTTPATLSVCPAALEVLCIPSS